MSNFSAVYGQALYDLAKEEGIAEQVLAQMQVLTESFQTEPKYIRLLSAANIGKAERCQIVDDCFRGKVEPCLLNFMKILTEKGAMGRFDQCFRHVRECYNQDNGILEVKAVTALALTDDQAQRLKEKLAKITGKTVCLINQVDASVLGGVRLDYDGKRLDDTVQHRLDSIRSLLANTVL